ncbi:hypothetical protein OCGS_0415 [Oceaniovalibus guishaninsula JLT2003]|uniref:Mechanosensitive ion channel family protein n=1 Tax=Oceaniovalibus guishaninsula JLT2003 TaxID=1231392 RepID=K2I8E4_9RHOB|nr:mechanosensitive ion channel family protein [Oceaniovalibus guishaninsula]EKE45325.1 hypothetical protein OCGS_0415 [Oceaniovalibus guishaninsula JLT2003]
MTLMNGERIATKRRGVLVWLAAMVNALLLAVMLATPVTAQSLPGTDASADDAPAAEEVPPDPLGRRTPRGMVDGLIGALAAEDYEKAARFLDLSGIAPALRDSRGPALALALETALDRLGGILPTYRLSTDPEGQTGDALPPDQDAFAFVKTDDTMTELLAHRVPDDGAETDGMIWLVAPDTLELVAGVTRNLSATLVDRWTPEGLQGLRLFGVPAGHWIGILVAAAAAIVLARLLTLAGLWLLARFWRPLRHGHARRVARALLVPLGLFVACWIFNGLMLAIGISVVARAVLAPGVEIVAYLSLAWLAWRGVNAAAVISLDAMSRRGRLGGVSVVTLAKRAALLLIVVIAAIAIAGSLGLNLTGWLAALGIGGLAFALGAQKTIEQFVGSVSIIADQPIRIGDFCSAGGVVGTVEDIGMRSTRIRTLARTTVTIPNGNLSQSQIENFATRDRFLFNPLLMLVLDTSPGQMRTILANMRRMLEDDPRVFEGPRVSFKEYGDSSLNVEIFAYVLAADYGASMAVVEDLNLAIMDIVHDAGSRFAVPSRLIYAPPGSGDDAPDNMARAAE